MTEGKQSKQDSLLPSTFSWRWREAAYNSNKLLLDMTTNKLTNPEKDNPVMKAISTLLLYSKVDYFSICRDKHPFLASRGWPVCSGCLCS